MIFQQKVGIIALDIDGTVTDKPYELDEKVIEALTRLAKKGWQYIFITGRPFKWGLVTLETLPFPYALAVQNGALLLDMPSRNILARKYLSLDALKNVEAIARQFSTDFIVYSGFEHGDCCYYRPCALPLQELAYGLKRAETLNEIWIPLMSFSELPMTQVSSIKFFANEKVAFELSQAIEQRLGLHAPPNRDPYQPDYFVIQATHAEATKGQILKDFAFEKKIDGPIIAAGDDHNDRSMLHAAHLKIVMANAPRELLDMADVIAPPASVNGIIQGLDEALNILRVRGGYHG